MSRHFLALVVALVYLLPALACLDDYGPTYDAAKGDYPYGERLLGYLETGDERFLDLELYEPRPELREPHPDFDRARWKSYWVFPVAALLSAASCRLFWTELGWLPAMSAHHLPFVLITAALVFVVCSFARARWGALAGVVAGGTLFLTPSFFGHSFNNPKDITECFLYTGAVLLGLRALESGKRRLWLFAGAATGLALAQKANALFLPLQLGLFVLGLALYARVKRQRGPDFGWQALLLATSGFLVLYYAASPAFWSAPIAGPKQWLGQMISVGNPAVRESSAPTPITFTAVLAVLQTTPLALLVLGVCGFARPGLDFRLRWFLLVSALLPIARNLLPGMRSFDGVRHFFEFLPMWCLAAGAGAAWLVERAAATRWSVPPRVAQATVALVALGPAAFAVVSTHPNQIAWFNTLAGGLGGAQARRAQDASDYWGNSYWQGLEWLSEHAEPDSRVLVLFKEFIARAGVPVRLRGDIKLPDPSRVGEKQLPLYVMHLVNKGGGPFQSELDKADAPLHDIRVQNGSVLHIHRLEQDERGRALIGHWQREFEQRILRGDVQKFLGQDKALQVRVMNVLREKLPRAQTLERLSELLPPEILAQVDELLPED